MKSTFTGILLLFGLSQVSLAEDTRETYELTYEVFSLPLREAAKLKRKNTGGAAMHAHLVKRVEKNEARQEKWKVLKMISEQNFSMEEFEEYIYPSEYDWGDLIIDPATNTHGSQILQFQPPAFPLPSPPLSFDTKKVGDSFEGEFKISNQIVGLRMNTMHIGHLTNDSFGKGVSEWVTPRFSVQRILGRVKVGIGKPALVGTLSPPKEAQTEKEKRIWMAFVTVEKT